MSKFYGGDSNSKKALLIADYRSFRNLELIEFFVRSGFSVDLITTSKFHFIYPYKNKIIYLKNWGEMPDLVLKLSEKYLFIVPLGDQALKIIKDSRLSQDQKLKILPVTRAESINHLCSKIGLSQAFQLGGVLTPDFIMVDSGNMIEKAIANLGYPVLLKIDFSGGGVGVHKISSYDDLKHICFSIDHQRVLIQKFVEGEVLDLSAFYLNEELIFFSFSKALETVSGIYGPSSLRHYVSLKNIEPEIFNELERLGQVLGIHGFANIGCIKSIEDSKRYYFECDVRPNDWVNFPRYLGDDSAQKLRNYFGVKQEEIQCRWKNFPSKSYALFANPSRLSLIKLWEYRDYWFRYTNLINLSMNILDPVLFHPRDTIKKLAVNYIKPNLPKYIWAMVKKITI